MSELRLLGPVEVRTTDGQVHAGEPRRLAVLAALLIDAGQVVPATTLIDRVWGEDPPAQAAKTLGTYVTRIRRLLEVAFGDDAVQVVSQPGGYRLTARPDQVDLFRFRDLVAQARAASDSPPRRVELLRQAVSLWRGDPLTGVNGAWAERTRERLTGEHLAAMAEWADAEMAVGNPGAVLAPLLALTDAHPLMEPLLAALVRALVAAGRPTEALERCREHQQRLVEEYGTDPSPQLRALYERILRDGELSPPVATEAAPAPLPAGTVLATRPRSEQTPVGTAPPPTIDAPRPDDAGVSPPRPVTVESDGPPVMRGKVPRLARGLLAACGVTAVVFGAVALGTPLGRTDEHTARNDRPSASTPSGLAEEFAGSTLNPQWHPYDQQRPNGSAWSPSMVRVDGGELQITGTGRNPKGVGNLAGGICWCVEEEHAPVRRFGIWQVRAKFDVGTGYGAVVGLYPASDGDSPGWGYLTMARLDQGARTSMYPQVGNRDDTVTGSAVSGDYTTWNTYSIEWRPDFTTISLNENVIFDSRKSAPHMSSPAGAMYLYIQLVPGPEDTVPAPNQDTPTQVVAHVDWVRYTP